MGNTVKVSLNRFNDPNKSNEFIVYSCMDMNPYSNKRNVAINLEVTKQELDSLFDTKKYERLYQPEYYSPLDELLGELWNDETVSTALHLIDEKVTRWIPREAHLMDYNTQVDKVFHTSLYQIDYQALVL
jgi:phage baseplate assembly protein W